MIYALFGVTCVGKTTIGKAVSERLGYCFYDLDTEIKSFYNDTLTNIYDSCICRHEIDSKKATVLKNILDKCGGNTIIAVSPIYYTTLYKTMFIKQGVFPIVLEDTPENIADRLVYTDFEDKVIEHPTNINRKQEVKDIRYFINRYKNAYSRIGCHYHINGESIDDAANGIINEIIKRVD
ncbi:MAG TPA: hypothetical protein DEQ30_12155, partial [Porphyromonadaceae bacterium]|nr:hypothetical protein [Porphyromonadaceae bacterium]